MIHKNNNNQGVFLELLVTAKNLFPYKEIQLPKSTANKSIKKIVSNLTALSAKLHEYSVAAWKCPQLSSLLLKRNVHNKKNARTTNISYILLSCE